MQVAVRPEVAHQAPDSTLRDMFTRAAESIEVAHPQVAVANESSDQCATLIGKAKCRASASGHVFQVSRVLPNVFVGQSRAFTGKRTR